MHYCYIPCGPAVVSEHRCGGDRRLFLERPLDWRKFFAACKQMPKGRVRTRWLAVAPADFDLVRNPTVVT